ncbi:hypothetical protein ACG04R_16995 [Roseateles sp. BYS78W]|uniref:Uncharacterized protein n=1 Tax=Pelomonas candidula TaxID=3299025 RepID=A0ABW7HFD3_9BURK
MLVPAGSYVNTSGASVATLAPVGTYVPTAGASVATQAPAGSYVSTPGATVPTLAPVGRYVPTAGASMAQQAPVGTYVATPGASAPIPAPVGSYVATAGASAATLAPAGSFVSTAGASSAQSCPSGSLSYGGAVACRATDGSASGPSLVSPHFQTTAGWGANVDLGDSFSAGSAWSMEVGNASADAADGKQTLLTLLSATLDGTDSVLRAGRLHGRRHAADR